MKRKDIQQTVEDKAHQAADLGAQALSVAKAKITPYVEQASEKVAPITEKVGPLAHDAVTKSAQVTVQALETLQPHIEEALAKIGPVIEDARDKVTTDIWPKVTEVLHETAARPSALNAIAAPASASTEVEVKKKKGSALKKVFIFSTITAGLASVVVLIKRLTESKSGWEPHTPSSYIPPSFSTDQAAQDMAAEGGPLTDQADSAGASDEQVSDLPDEQPITDESKVADESKDPDQIEGADDSEDASGGDESPFRE